jgi:hypothetical protein
MAVRRGIGASQLAQIRQGFAEVKQIIAERTEKSNLRGLIRDLRSIPTSERDKKRELAAFFQTEVGERYTREERHQAYNDLLGRDENSRHRG